MNARRWKANRQAFRPAAARLVVASVLILAAIPLQGATSEEALFKVARAWTVRVRFTSPAVVEDESIPSEGAGFVVDAARGWVMTNAHVAGRWPNELQIAFEDGRLIPAKQVYVDPHLDVAVISYLPAQRRQPPPVPSLECQSMPSAGHPVGTFGHPWGYRFTSTRGIVSGVTTRDGSEMLQTDAPMNFGNSGGPLISLVTGRVVGISTAKVSDERAEGLSFAVPMPYACKILRLLQARGDPSPPMDRIAFAVEENNERGLLVARNGFPAAVLDLRPGDDIIAAQGRTVSTPTQLIHALRGSLDSITLTVRRDSKQVRIAGKLPSASLLTERQGIWLDGALIAPSDDALGALQEDGPGLMVHEVDGASEAQAVGIKPFDLVQLVNGRPVRTLEELDKEITKSTGANRGVELLLLRRMEEGSRLFEYHRRRVSGEVFGWVGEVR